MSTNIPNIKIFSDNGSVYAEVTVGKKPPKKTKLMEYTGSNKVQLAADSAISLQKVIDNGDLYNGKLEVYRNKFIVDNSIIPFNTTTIIDLNAFPKKERTDVVKLFNYQLWASGIMPSEKEIAEKEIRKLEHQMKYRRERNLKLKGYEDLASLYMAVNRYEDAEETANKILNFDLALTSARPIFYDEAAYLISDLNRLRALKDWEGSFMMQAVTTLREKESNLRDLEFGYKRRYNLELLETCADIYGNFRHTLSEGEINQGCSPTLMATYLDNATRKYNSYSPAFADNYIAVRSFIEYGRYSIYTNDLERADKEFDRTLAVIKMIKDPWSIREENDKETWELLKDYMPRDNRAAAKLGVDAAMWYYSLKADVASTLRRTARSDQFHKGGFNLFEALALQGKGDVERKKYSVAEEPETKLTHLKSAIKFYRYALGAAQKLLNANPYNFYTSAMTEEHEVYYELMVNLSEAELEHALLSGKADIPARVTRRLDKVIDFYQNKEEDSTNTSYLNALMLKAFILRLSPEKLEESLNTYKKVADIINRKFAGVILPPYLSYVRSSAVINSTMLEIMTSENIEAEASELFKTLETARAEVEQSISVLPELSESAERAISQSWALEGEIHLTLGDPEAAETAFARVNDKHDDLTAQSRIRRVEIEIGDVWKLKGSAEKMAKIEYLLDQLGKAGEALNRAKIKPDSYLRLERAYLEATFLIMRNDQRQKDGERVITLSEWVISAVNASTSTKPHIKTYFTMLSKLRIAQALIQMRGAENRESALVYLKEIEATLGYPITPYIFDKLRKVPFQLDGGEPEKTKPILTVVSNVLRENGRIKMADQLVEAMSLIDEGKLEDAKFIIAKVTRKLDEIDKDKAFEKSVEGIEWDIHSFKAEVYHQLAIIYAHQDKGMFIHEYANSACSECGQSQSRYDVDVRIDQLYEMLGKPGKASACYSE